MELFWYVSKDDCFSQCNYYAIYWKETQETETWDRQWYYRNWCLKIIFKGKQNKKNRMLLPPIGGHWNDGGRNGSLGGNWLGKRVRVEILSIFSPKFPRGIEWFFFSEKGLASRISVGTSAPTQQAECHMHDCHLQVTLRGALLFFVLFLFF